MKNKAVEFLQEYSTKTNFLIEKYLDKKIKEASSIGIIPQKILEKFKEMCLLGKKIRGALMVLGYQACGGKDYEEILKVSIFIELFQTGILVHDDIMDNASFRRGLASLNKEFNNNLAICIGDFAFFQAFEILSGGNFSLDAKLKAIELFSQYSQRLAYGQEMDTENNNLQNITEKDILNIYRYKTAEYTGVLPFLIGAVLAGEKDKAKLRAISDFGLALGWIFQLTDDILGILREEEETGKSATSDLSEGKITLLQLYLYKHGNDKQKILQKRLLGKKNISDKEVEEMRIALRESGALEKTENMMAKYSGKAINLIPEITDDKRIREIFQDLAEFVRKRGK